MSAQPPAQKAYLYSTGSATLVTFAQYSYCLFLTLCVLRYLLLFENEYNKLTNNKRRAKRCRKEPKAQFGNSKTEQRVERPFTAVLSNEKQREISLPHKDLAVRKLRPLTAGQPITCDAILSKATAAPPAAPLFSPASVVCVVEANQERLF